MPCDSVVINKYHLDDVTKLDTLYDALANPLVSSKHFSNVRMHANGTITAYHIESGNSIEIRRSKSGGVDVDTQGDAEIATLVKRCYSKESVMKSAKMNNWKFKVDTKDEWAFELQKI